MNIKISPASKIFLTLLFVYLILFEFILPINNILPKPSFIIESFTTIWSDYNIAISLLETYSIIVFSFLGGYFLCWLFRGLTIYFGEEQKEIFSSFSWLRSVNIFFVVILVGFWFGDSITAFMIFMMIFQFLGLMNELMKLNKEDEAYQLTVMSLSSDKNRDMAEIKWKLRIPQIYKSIIEKQSLMWLLVLTYEFIHLDVGVGYVIKQILAYKDFTGLFPIIIITALLYKLNFLLLKISVKKYAFWRT
jgi:ABC-type nitrate/sulfonate/bicarbonate transport system permease component